MPDEIKELEKKICKHCLIEKPVSFYNKAGGGRWLQPYCKPCDSARKKKYTQENIDKVKEKRRQYYLDNKDYIIATTKERAVNKADEIKEYRKKYNELNKEAKNERNKEYRKKFGKQQDEKQKMRRKRNPEFFKQKAKIMRDSMSLEEKQKVAQYQKEYRAKNKHKYYEYREKNKHIIRAKRREYCRRKNSEDIEYKIVKNLRTRIRFALKKDGGIKSDTTEKLLGCSISYFVEYFKSLFTDGMTWERFMKGEIQIDHKKPCAEFDLTKEEEQRICFHYTNLQPLWELDNLKKGAKYG